MQDNKEEMMRRYKFKQSLEKLRNNQRENEEKMNHPFQGIGNGISNAYKTINGINKANELYNNWKNPMPSQEFMGKVGAELPQGMNFSTPADSMSGLGNTSLNTQAIPTNTIGNAAEGASKATGALGNASSALGNAAPVVGTATGLYNAGKSFANGDYTNGAMDLASTGAMFIPGVGWAVAGAIKIGQMIKNMFDKKRQEAMKKSQEEAAKSQKLSNEVLQQQQQSFDEVKQENAQKLQQQIDKQNQDTMAQQQQAPQDLKQDIYNKVFSPEQIGQYGQGNIDLYNRPQVQNPDGSISTVRSKSFNIDGKETLIPTVSDDGRIMSDDEAIDNFYKTGKHLGQFNSVDEANKYAQNLHNQQEGIYTGGASDVQQGYSGQLPDLTQTPTSYAEENAPALSYDGSATQALDEQKQSLMDKFRAGLSDFNAGYQDNANTDFAHGDLMNKVTGGAAPTQSPDGTHNLSAEENKKSVMARLGELAGTGQRIMSHPLTQAAIAGGISRAAGGDIDDIAKAAYQYGTAKANADRYYQQVTGNTNRPFLNTYSPYDVTNKRLEDQIKQRQDQYEQTRQDKIDQQKWERENKEAQQKWERDYKTNKDTQDRAIKREEVAARKKYWEARGGNDRGNNVAQQKYDYQQGFNKSVGQFQKYADALEKAKEKDGWFANSNDKAAIAQAQEQYNKAREFMINTYGGDFIKYAKEQGWE